MTGLRFERQAPVAASHPNRTDIACFVGFVGRRPGSPVPAELRAWLRERGWLHRGYVRRPVEELLDVPVPVDAWDDFDHLFEWERRDPDGGGPAVGTYLGAAVRSFFAQGGRKCYVVRVGDDLSSVVWSDLRVETPLADRLFEDELRGAGPAGDPWRAARGRFMRTAAGLRSVAPAAGHVAAAGFITVGPDYAVEAALSGRSPVASGGLVARFADADNYYFADLSPGARRKRLVLGVRLAGVESELASAELRLADSSGHRLRLEVTGARLRASVDGGLPLEAVDASLAEAGVAGVRVGAAPSREIALRRRLERLLPGFPDRLDVTGSDRTTWRGVGHLFGLPDVSFLCLPDLGEIVRAELPRPALDRPPSPPGNEKFVECSVPQPPPPRDNLARRLPAPRADERGYESWADAVGLAARFLARRHREVQLLAAVPLPADDTPPAADLHGFLVDQLGLSGPLDSEDPLEAGLSSSFVQLVFPWASTPGGSRLPEGLESPDGLLAGILARNAIARGTFRSAAALDAGDLAGLSPALSREQQRLPHPGQDPALSLVERVSLLGETPSGLRLLSDVTTSVDESYRPAAVGRLVALLVRAARRLGEDETFESSGEALWSRLRSRMSDLLLELYQAGALRGRTPEEAFHVRCDRGTMTQRDLDEGRVVARVRFEAALPIDEITVVLAMDEGGSVSLLRSEGREEAA